MRNHYETEEEDNQGVKMRYNLIAPQLRIRFKSLLSSFWNLTTKFRRVTFLDVMVLGKVPFSSGRILRNERLTFTRVAFTRFHALDLVSSCVTGMRILVHTL